MMDTTEYFIRNKIIKESDVYETFVVEGYKEFVLPRSEEHTSELQSQR